MKYNELREIAEKFNYEIEEDTLSFILKNKDCEKRIIMINKQKEKSMIIQNGYFTEDLEVLKAAIEVSETPIEEREEKKFFNVFSKLTNENTCLIKSNGNIDNLVWDQKDNDNARFTQKEIDYIKEKFDTDLKDFNIIEIK